jgi:hypothetical protein
VRRETRVNLIFLVAFLALSLPGAVILFRKKLDPGAPRMDQPDMMVTRLPYMAPLPAPTGVKWVVPDRTRACGAGGAAVGAGHLSGSFASGDDRGDRFGVYSRGAAGLGRRD